MTEDNRLGDIIESYRLARVLGSGSTSVVYLGERLDDPLTVVAIKVLTLDEQVKAIEDSTFHIRFLQEARAASRLRHDHILPVLSYGDADGVTYMVMPVVGRGTIGTLLASHKGPLPLEEIANYLLQLGAALDFAHSQGVVHRDVKPSNILLDEQDQIYLTDFGIAHIFSVGGDALTRISGAGSGSLTHTGEVLGTPYYMAPEQIKSEPVGPPADVYALGIVTYQLVTGQLPFASDTPLAVAMQHLQEEPCPPSLLRQDLPEASQNAILRALAKQPQERFASAGAFAEAFAADILPAQHAGEHEAGTLGSATRPVMPPQGLANAAAGSVSDAPTLLSPGPRSSTELNALAAARTPRPDATSCKELVGTTVGAYHLDALLESEEVGAAYAARSDAVTTPFRLRIAAAPSVQTPEARSLALARFQRQAHDVSTLTHPYLIPVVDYGTFRGMPYLVTPAAPGPSLAQHLANNGPMELNLTGRYLEQIAAALEYVHAHDMLHRSLSPKCVFLDHDGHAVVADTEACRLLDLTGPVAVTGRSCGLAPEQLRGNAVGTFTDVYALGEVLYQMLTAHPLYSGATRDEIVQQHLHSTVPPLRRWRGALPAGLEAILSRALAKEPEQRYRHATELSNAYRLLISRQGSSPAQPFIITQAPSVSLSREGNRLMVTNTQASTQSPMQAPVQASDLRSDVTPRAARVTFPLEEPLPETAVEDATKPAPSVGSTTGRTWHTLVRTRWVQNGFFAALVLILIGGTVALVNGYPGRLFSHSVAAGGAKAEAFFLDNPTGPPGHTDEVRLDVTGLAAAPEGDEYDAWLASEQSEHFLALGTLTPKGKNFVLTYGGDRPSGTNLLGAGDKIEITLEHGSVQAPAGTVVLVGQFPTQAFVHIQHLLVAFPDTPNHIGFLVGLLDQTQRLYGQSQRLQDDAHNGDTDAVRCRAQSIVDILEGTHGPNYQPLPAACAGKSISEDGDGYGLLHFGNELGYLDGAADHAALSAQAPDATELIKTHAGHVQVAVTNIQGWVKTVDQDAVNLVKNPSDQSHVDEIAALSDHAYNGQNLDADESIDPVPGEAGAKTAYEHGQLLSTLTLNPSK